MNWKSRKVLVTGGAGFIGSALVRQLAKMGPELYVLDNMSTGVRETILGCCNSIEISNITLINDSALSDMKSVDLVFHLAAPSSDVLFRENPVRCLSDTLVGFAEVLRFASRHAATKLVYATSSSVYGGSKPPQSETTQPNPTNLYGVGKQVCELMAGDHANVPSIGLRIFAGYGPGELPKGRIASVITLFVQQLMSRRPLTLFGNGSQARDFIYIEDIVNSLIRAAEVPNIGVVNVGSGESTTFVQIVKELENLLGIKAELRYAAPPAGYFASTLADTTKMRSMLGIEPRNLHDGLQEYLRISGRQDNVA